MREGTVRLPNPQAQMTHVYLAELMEVGGSIIIPPLRREVPKKLDTYLCGHSVSGKIKNFCNLNLVSSNSDVNSICMYSKIYYKCLCTLNCLYMPRTGHIDCTDRSMPCNGGPSV